MKNGYVYILQNPSFPNDLLKIGMTTRTPEIRAREIYEHATGVPTPFDVAFSTRVSNCELAESIAHTRLGQYRNDKNREFFKLSLGEAEKIIVAICMEVEELYSSSKIIRADNNDFNQNYDASAFDNIDKQIDRQVEAAKKEISDMSNAYIKSYSNLDVINPDADKVKNSAAIEKKPMQEAAQVSTFKWKWYYWLYAVIVAKTIVSVLRYFQT